MTLRDLMRKATDVEGWRKWNWIPPSAGSRYGSIVDNISGVECRLDTHGPLIVALHNCAEEMLKVVDKAERLVGDWNMPDCDCPPEGHICGWPKVVELRAALAALKEKEGL